MEVMVEKVEILYYKQTRMWPILRNYHFKKHWKAKNGEPGRGSDQNGRGGDPCILKVPMGTEVREMDSGELICELLDHEQEVLLLEGGKGWSR